MIIELHQHKSRVSKLGIIHKREGNVCEKCKKENTEVGKMTDYTDPHDGYGGLLCSECIKKREKPYTEICPKCKDNAYDNGGMTIADKDEPPFEEMCMKCYEKDAKRKERLRKTKKTVKTNWYRLAIIAIGIVGVVVAAVVGFYK